jgi:hypothetical protein
LRGCVKNAYRWAPGAACANEAITASGRSDRAFYRHKLEYHGPVLALWATATGSSRSLTAAVS